ncbi:BatD family protein [Schlesneria sp. T3-172]|uniref:BatD family protein n=1 Tax=Schlesneria sphaerica TaxID=3373610 RepID=UPI0037CC5DC2
MSSRVQFDFRNRRYFFSAGIWLLVCLIGTAELIAAAPEVRVVTSAEEIYVGDSIDYQVEVQNVESPPRPDLSGFEELFDVAAKGDSSRNQSSITIINGKVSQQNILSHVFLYRLTPRIAGELTIPPAKVSIEGKTYSSEEVPLKVIAAEEQDLVLMEMKVNPSQVYPTQPFTVTLRVLVQPVPNNPKLDPLTPLTQRPPHLQVNWVDPPSGLTASDKQMWLQPMLSDDGVGFTLNDLSTRTDSFFGGSRAAVFNLVKGRESRKNFEGKDVDYFVYELSRTLTAEKTGEYALGPAFVKGTFVAGVERREYRGRRLVASSPAIKLEVREVPSPRPPTYCGGIGEYRVTASASPMKLRVGDPLTLTLKFDRGNQAGSLDLISAPGLAEIPELAENFDLIDKSPTGRVEGTSKLFTYALRPKRLSSGVPPLSISTFNPQSEQFETIATQPIPLEITEADRLSVGDIKGSLTTSSPAAIKSRAEGIFQNITNLSAVRNQRVSLLSYVVASGAVWGGAGVAIGLTALLRRRNSDERFVRRQQARSNAQRRLSEARSLTGKGDAKVALRTLRAALIGLIADLKNRVADGLTSADVREILAGSSVTEEDRAAVIRLLESIESAEYGGAQSVQIEEAMGETSRLIGRLTSGLERA